MALTVVGGSDEVSVPVCGKELGCEMAGVYHGWSGRLPWKSMYQG
jgi:hypothetical protein